MTHETSVCWMFCLWWWVLLGFLSARGCQVIQDFLSLPVDEAPEVSIFPPIILKPFNMTSDLIFAPGKCSYPCPCVAVYLGSRVSRWARGTSSSRATGIPLETAHNAHIQLGRVVLLMDCVVSESETIPSLHQFQEYRVHRHLQCDHQDPTKH